MKVRAGNSQTRISGVILKQKFALLPNALLGLLLWGTVAVALMGAIAVLAWSAWNHSRTLSRSVQMIAQLACSQTAAKPGDAQVRSCPGPLTESDLNSLIAKLDAIRKETFDSTAVAFLWTFFMFLVVNLALALYLRARRDYRKINTCAEQVSRGLAAIEPLLESVSETQVLAVLYTRAERLAASLNGGDGDVRSRALPPLYDTLKEINERLQDRRKHDLALEPLVYRRVILDLSTAVHSAVRTYQESHRDGGSEVLSLSQQCLDELGSSPFPERFQVLQRNLRTATKVKTLPDEDLC